MPASGYIFMKLIASTFLIAIIASLTVGQSYRPDPWLEDLSQLKREMSSHYANLEWAVSERGMDLRRLSDETETAIRAAKTDGEARIAIGSFLRAFGDGHLRVEWGSNAPSQPAAIQNGPLCERLGYRSRPPRTTLEFTALKGFTSLDFPESKIIPAGKGILSNGKRFGVVGIRLFDDTIYPELCESAAAELKLAPDSPCDEDCVDRIRSRTGNMYVAALAAQVKRLTESKIDILVVDLVGNGGGIDIYQPMARMLTPLPLTSPVSGFVRHPHWIKQNRDRLAEIEAALSGTTGEMRKKLNAAVAAAKRDLHEAETRCDLSPLWENRKSDCSLVVRFAENPARYAKPGELSNTVLGDLYFSASRYHYQEGLYKGKLVVLVDPRTASSSEAFASMLRDNNAATVIGYPTLGAGCGYTNGGIPTTLKNSGARVRMPDCVRYRLNGMNEINGITPDVWVPWRQNDSPYQRVKRVVDVLAPLS